MNQIYNFLDGSIFRLLNVERFTGGAQGPPKKTSLGTAIIAVLMLSVFGSIGAYSQTTYYSKSAAVDFNDVNSWGTANDGTGAAPAAISNADNFIVANNAVLSLTGNAAVRELTINSGSLTVAANALTVSKAGAYNTTLSIASGGTLNVSGGTVNLNGNFTMANGSNLNQSGGDIIVDGNDNNTVASSVASGTPLFRIGNSTTAYSSGTINLTGGTITIVDPHTATTNTNGYAVYVYFPSGFNVEAGANHTFRFGDGVSTTTGGHTSGFYVDPFVSSGRLNFGSLIVNNPSGTNRVVVTPFNTGVHGNVSVMAGEFRPNALVLQGNLTVAGTFVATNTFNLAIPTGTSTAVNTVAQTITISAGGIIKNAATAETANIASLTVNNTAGVTFQGTSTIASQPASSLSVSGTLTFTAGKITTAGFSSFVLGNSTPSAGTLSYTSGGFASGTTFGRWFTATGTGTSITAGTDATSVTSRYPFVNAANQDRSAWIERVTPAAAAGVLGMTYNEVAGISTVALADGAFTADRKINDTWAVASLAGTPTAAASFKLQLQAPGAITAPFVIANTRIVQGATFAGAHQAGTLTPAGQRITLTAAELTAAPFSLAYSTSGIAVTPIADGNWNNPAIWSSGVVPSCTDAVLISANTTVTVNSAAAVSGQLIIASGGTLVVASGDLTVGCTLNNTSFTNNGTLTVSGGTLNVNGNMLHAAGSTFNHSAGDINIDGNNAGAAATSVASGTAIVQINTQNVNWTGGMLTIVDPHANSTATNTFAYSNATAHANVTAGHTIRFGNGTSTDAGGNATNGFRVATVGTNRISFFNFVVNGGTGTNRFVSVTSAFGINGNMTINAGSEYRDNGVATHIAGNLINNGSYIATSTLSFNSFLGGTSAPVTVAQTVTGTGTFTNLAAAPTANLNSLTINNTSAGGVTFGGFSNIATQPANSVSVSGTLTFIAGKLNSTGNATFVLGTSVPAAGSLTHTSGGFASGVTFGRWFTATGTGTGFTAGADATGTASKYPFVNSANQERSAWIERVTPAAAAGILGVTYNNTAGTTAINVTDTTPANFTVDTKANDTWAVTAIQGTPLAAATFRLQLQAPGIFGAPLATATTRIIQGSAFVGTHQAGTVTPGGQRILLTAAELTAAPFTLAVLASDISFSPIASGDWNNPLIWNKGVVPGCNDVVNITPTFNVTVNSAANVAKTVNIAAGGTLTVASGDLTVGCTLNNATLTNNGILTVTGGTLTVNGNINIASAAAVLNQSGGTIKIDGNADGVVADSVASGTALFNSVSQNINLTGGTLLFVDPHTATTNTNGLAIKFNMGTANTISLAASPAHTTQFGDGVSTTAGGHTNGFYVDNWFGTAYLSLGSIVVNGGSGTNRGVGSVYQLTANGNVTVNTGSTLNLAAALIVGGNLTVDGTFVNAGVVASIVASNSSTALTFGPAVNAQTFTNNGTVANSATTVTANFTNLQVNNTSVAGLTLASPFSLSGTLTLTAGKINTTTASMLTLGTATAAGTLTGGSATAYINGPFARTIASGNAATNYVHFPVGKAAYAPVWLAPTTTAVSVFKAEAFDTNTGTNDPSILNLSTTRRWEAPLVSGTFTDIKVRLGDAGIVTTSIPVQAPAATGAYASAFGSLATYAAGTPNTTQANNAVTAANYTGFLSFADSNSCMGVPTPGNTLISATNLCAGNSVTLSVQNQTTGSGVTYQWQSSTDGVAFADIATATATTLVTVPAAPLYYRLKVTCATGPDTAYSIPVQATFANAITATTPATRCGTGTVTLTATGSAATVQWYAAQTGGAALATGNSFTTPSISATTSYWVATAAVGGSQSAAKPAPNAASTAFNTTDWGIVFNASQSVQLQEVSVYSTSAGTINVKIVNSAGTELYETGNINIAAGGTTTPNIVPLNYTVAAGTGYRILIKAHTGVNLIRDSSGLTFPYNGGDGIISVPSAWNGSATTGSYYWFYDLKYVGQCSSPRSEVVATVNAAPALTLSANTATICAGQTTSAVTLTAGASDYDTYTWTPSAGVTGNATTGWTFNPTVTTTYTLVASQSAGAMCVSNGATVVVTANPLPSVLTIAPPAGPVCLDSVVTLTATGGGIPASGTIGTGTTTTGATEELTAFSNRRISYKMQIIYTAAELQAAGLQAGNITSLAFNIATIGDAATNNNYTVKIGSTANAAFPNTSYISESTFTPVFGPVTYTHQVGQNVIPFSTPYMWDGTSNIVVSISHLGINSINNAQTYYTDLGANTTLYNFNDLTAATGTSSTKRFNVTFTGQAQGAITWTPSANLYTDVAATTAYVAGANAATVYAKTNTAATNTYTATATSAAGCTRTQTVDVTVVNCAIDFANLQSPATATITTCGSQVVTGQVLKTGVTEAAGAATGMKAWVGVSTTNSDPSTWTEANWHLAAFSTQAGNNDEFAYTVTGLAAGTYYYATRYQYLTGTYVYGGLSGFWNAATSVSGTLTVNAVTAPTAADLTFCNGTPTVANLTAIGTDLKWYAGPTGGTALASTTALTTTTYYVSQTISGCEGPRTAVAVTVNVTAAPTASALTFCNVATVADLTATGTALQWYADLTSVTALTPATVITGNGTYYVSQTINGCESARIPVTVTLNTTAAPTASALTFCNGAPTVADLTATGTALQWYANATGGTALAATTPLVNGGVYYVSQTINGCESTRTSVTVTLNTTAAPTASALTFCNASPTVADLTATGTALQWYADATGGAALASTTPLVSGTYHVSQTINGCESARTSVTVTLNTTAAPTASALTFCNASPTVADLTATGTALQWYADATGGAALAATTPLVNGGVYHVSQTINGCESARTSVTVTINTTAAPVAAAAQTLCAGSTVADIDATGTALQWYSSETGNNPIATTTVLANGTIYYVSQIINGCESARTGVTATITTVPADVIADQIIPCGTYTLPALTNGNYFGGPNGTGTAYTAGQVITSDMTMYIFNQVGTCTAQTSFTIDVNIVATPTGDAIQTVNINDLADATIADLTVTATGTVTWFASEADALAGAPVLAADTQLINGEDYFAVQTIGTCASAPFEVTVTVALGRDDFELENIKYYPNPVVDKLTISYSSNITQVEVYNLLGQLVISQQPNAATVEINMDRLESATYIVKVTADGKSKDFKVVRN